MELITKLGLGTVQFGVNYGISNKLGKTPKEELKEILNIADKLGINVIDTAMAYGNAEEVIGNYNLKRFNVVSKFMETEQYGSIDSQLENSLSKLQIPNLYGYLFHRPMSLFNNNNYWKELIELKAKGKIKKIGFSLNSVEEIEGLVNNGFIPDLVQVPYNYFDNRFENWMILLKEKGCEIHTRSTFLQGLFFMNVNNLGSFFNSVKPIIKKLQTENEFLAGSLLSYSLKKEFIDKVIIGVENKKQLVQNIKEIKNSKKLINLKENINNSILNPSLWEK